ncbi:hypothetical protein IT072_15455 [Leifsonia sp. ZF2019]|uniref:hypothetical protein n=1 Tax=Leifsonia sp. ZF2019 TaxID=2781978 RepID=UPI001CBD76E9|nr:hypothetical protein [Leifsonia sp. ZF2019]UAJ78625.1 hypothetical protein IT072_15455 [Leifsonia sp. ZF2019]
MTEVTGTDPEEEPNELHYILKARIELARIRHTSARALCGETLDDVDPGSADGGDGKARKLCVSCEWIYEHLPEE